MALYTVYAKMTKRNKIKILYETILLVFCVNLLIDGVVMREIRETRSARPFTESIQKEYPLTKDNVFVMNNLREYRNLYAMNFYMGNSFRNFETEQPSHGFFLTTEKDAPRVIEQYDAHYHFEQLAISEQRQGDIRSKAILFRITQRNLIVSE